MGIGFSSNRRGNNSSSGNNNGSRGNNGSGGSNNINNVNNINNNSVRADNSASRNVINNNRGNGVNANNTRNSGRGRVIPARVSGNNTNRNNNSGVTAYNRAVEDPNMVAIRDELLRAQMEREMSSQRIARRAARRETLYARLWVFFFIFILILVIVTAVILVSFRNTDVQETDDEYVYVYGTGKDEKDIVPFDSAVRNGKLYINYSKLARTLDMAVTGDGNVFRFITKDGSEDVKFTVGTTVIYVNSNEWRMSSPSYRVGDDIWVPLDFVIDSMIGIKVDVDEKERTITITRDTDEAGDALPVAFKMKEADTLAPITEDESYGDTTAPDSTDGTDTEQTDIDVPVFEFKADLSKYEKYMNPDDDSEYLILVNADNPLDKNYVPDDLVDVVNTRADGRNKQKMRLYAAKALEAMFIELFANGYDKKGPSGYPVSVMSAYRSYATQASLFNSYVEREMASNPSLTRAEAEAITETYSARPGTSEHQTGLCADLHNLSSAMQSFARQDAYKWLVDNCYKFGFILRYPEDKVDITKITFEPWHYRFVGRKAAYEMHELGMCLEEYVEYINQNR